MDIICKYISYIRDVRRYSANTSRIYEDVLKRYAAHVADGSDCISDDDLIASLNHSELRSYMVSLMESDPPMSPSSVNLHLSSISGFCRFLIREGLLQTNPVTLLSKPRSNKRLPSFFRKDVLEGYFHNTYIYSSREFLNAFLCCTDKEERKHLYEKRLSRLILSMLYNLGLRRAELISIDIHDVDLSRKIVKIAGKGNKMREIPVLDELCEEILLYLEAVEALVGRERSLKEPLLVTYSDKRLYPVYVDRTVKRELSMDKGTKGRKSPHVLRHSLATGLLDEGADMNSIKELLGHSSLAATQVYTHNTIAKMKNIYESAHPRAKNGGKNGD